MKDFNLRKSIRLTTSPPVKFKLFDVHTCKPSSAEIHGQLRNISVDGLCLETNIILVNKQNVFLSCLRGDKQLQMEVELPYVPEPLHLHLRGNVTWFNSQPSSSTYQFLAGINITDASEDTRNIWKNYVKEHKSKWYK